MRARNNAQCLVPIEQFVRMTNMELTTFYILYIGDKLPIVKRPVMCLLTLVILERGSTCLDYKPVKDLF
jgi:hypothetical protein